MFHLLECKLVKIESNTSYSSMKQCPSNIIYPMYALESQEIMAGILAKLRNHK